MSNVLVEKQKIDILANAISAKSGEPVTMTLEEMVEAVDSIEAGGGEPNLQAKTYTVNSAGTATVTADSGYDGLSSVSVSVPSAEPWIGVANTGFYTESNNRRWRFKPMVEFSEGEQIGWMDTDTFGAYWSCPAVPSGTTITPTESSQTIGGYGYMMEGAVTVSAISSSYVGSGITRRNSTDLSASGATVTVPEGFYASQTTKSVGTAVLEGDSSITVTPVITVENGVITASVSTTSAISPVYTSGYYDSSRTVNVAVTGSATATAPSGGSASIATVTTTNSSDQNTSISFTLPSGRTPKAFFVRLTSQIARSSSYRYYFVENVRWDGSSSGGFAGRCFYRYNGTLTNVTSGYSKSQSGTTFTLSSTGSRSASPGSFYNGTYEMVYVY